MKKFISATVLALTLLGTANGAVPAASTMISWASPGVMFPNEASPQGLPEAIPCNGTGDDFGGVLHCQWFTYARNISVPTDATGEYVTTTNILETTCRGGVCRSIVGEVGVSKVDRSAFISFWYRLAESTDGKPIAIRMDVPETETYSYVDTGFLLSNFYYEIGMKPENNNGLLGAFYKGGLAQYQKDFDANCNTPGNRVSCGE